MRRGFLRGSVWLLATGAAVAVSWWGIRGVMSETLGDPPHALVIDGKDTSSEEDAHTEGTPPAAPESAPSAVPPSLARSTDPSSRTPGGSSPGSPSRTPGSGASPRISPTPPSQGAQGGTVEPVDVAGGRVVFDIGPSSATLVSATPAVGWQMQTWDQSAQGWIRVTFTKGSREVSVFCTWHDHPPMVETQGE